MELKEKTQVTNIKRLMAGVVKQAKKDPTKADPGLKELSPGFWILDKGDFKFTSFQGKGSITGQDGEEVTDKATKEVKDRLMELFAPLIGVSQAKSLSPRAEAAKTEMEAQLKILLEEGFKPSCSGETIKLTPLKAEDDEASQSE